MRNVPGKEDSNSLLRHVRCLHYRFQVVQLVDLLSSNVLPKVVKKNSHVYDLGLYTP